MTCKPPVSFDQLVATIKGLPNGRGLMREISRSLSRDTGEIKGLVGEALIEGYIARGYIQHSMLYSYYVPDNAKPVPERQPLPAWQPPPTYTDFGVGTNGARPCFCGVWVSALRWHRWVTGHSFIDAMDAKFTPEDYARRLT